MKKLRIQPGQRILILNAPEGYLDLLSQPAGPPSSQSSGPLSSQSSGPLSSQSSGPLSSQSSGPLPMDLEISNTPGGKFDFVHIFAADKVKLDELKPVAADSIKYDALLWVSYPKKSSKVKSDLSRDMMWDLFTDDGLRPVTQISIDATWSALRQRTASAPLPSE
jgi:hypothetical protein